MSGGGEGLRGEIPVSPSDPFKRRGLGFIPFVSNTSKLASAFKASPEALLHLQCFLS